MTNRNSRFTPLYIAIAIVVGIAVGAFYTTLFGGNKLGIINASSDKLNALLRVINERYMDEISTDSLVEMTMPLLLGELDPHSGYMPRSEFTAFNEGVEGNFSGVGVMFSIHNDTAFIHKIIAGGPSEHVGLRPGDRITHVNDSVFTGSKLTNNYVLTHLRGEKGTKVKITVKRRGRQNSVTATVTRGSVPVNSVRSSYMIDDRTGYVRIDNFGRTTHVELLNSLAILSSQGMEQLILDLRGNTGGIMEGAIELSNEFLSRGSPILYVQGKHYPRQDFRANGHGSFQHLPLVVLIDEGSASSSEIFAGAMQDNDRATVIGRRSFGKGLVQQPIEFNDGSAIRLTIARYYTPSGRCIQRPYTNGYDAEYEMDLINRYERGEYTAKDNIHLDTTTTYYTLREHRPVYAGGGIMPDVFIPLDTMLQTSWYMEVRKAYLPERFAFEYIDKHRDRLSNYDTAPALFDRLRRDDIVARFAAYTETVGVKRRNLMINKSHALIEQSIVAQIIYFMLGDNEMYQYLNTRDTTVTEALKVLTTEADDKANTNGRTQPDASGDTQASMRRSALRSWGTTLTYA